MWFELGSEVIGSLMTFFATQPILATNPVEIAESVNVLTSLLWNILFGKQKKIN